VQTFAFDKASLLEAKQIEHLFQYEHSVATVYLSGLLVNLNGVYTSGSCVRVRICNIQHVALSPSDTVTIIAPGVREITLINTEAWSSGMGVGRGTNNPTL
jgi:hypothetical protein